METCPRGSKLRKYSDWSFIQQEGSKAIKRGSKRGLRLEPLLFHQLREFTRPQRKAISAPGTRNLSLWAFQSSLICVYWFLDYQVVTRAMNIFSAALGPQGVIRSTLLRSKAVFPHKASLLCVQVCSSGLLSTSTRQKLVASNVRLYLCHMSPSVVPVFHLPTLQWWAEQQVMQSKEDELLCLTAVWFSSVSFELFFFFLFLRGGYLQGHFRP